MNTGIPNRISESLEMDRDRLGGSVFTCLQKTFTVKTKWPIDISVYTYTQLKSHFTFAIG